MSWKGTLGQQCFASDRYRDEILMVPVVVVCGALLAVTTAAMGATSTPTPVSASRTHEVLLYFPDTVASDRTDIVAFAQEYLDEVASGKLNKPLRLQYFNRLADLRAYMERCRERDEYPEFGIVHAEIAREYRRRWNLDLIGYVLSKDGEKTHRLTVVSNRQSPIETLRDLRNRVLIAPEYWGRDLNRFERVVLGDEIAVSELKELKPADTSVSAVLGVYYGAGDAALVSNRVFSIMRQRVGAIWRSMEVIYESPSLPLVALVLFGDRSASEREQIAELAATAHETKAGRRWLQYVHLSKVVEGSWVDLFGPDVSFGLARDTGTEFTRDRDKDSRE